MEDDEGEDIVELLQSERDSLRAEVDVLNEKVGWLEGVIKDIKSALAKLD